jgi:Cys-tRNA(Pro)/Cys-tRNA(Cys) deacylase
MVENKPETIRNNITRLLDSRKISYAAFQLPPEKIGAVEAASFMGVPIEKVFKSIVIKRESRGKPLVVVIPGNKEVNLKQVARVLGEKKVHLPTEREAEQLTGLQAGGISPLALVNRGFQILIDSSAKEHESIHISGGQRGLNIRLTPTDLAALTRASFASLCDEIFIGD